MKKKFIRKKSYLIPSLIGLGGLVALSAASIYTLIPKIQNNLAEQVKVTLGQANITADIIVSGRDITLSGATINAEMSQLAIQKVMSTRGVRKVTNNLGKEGTGDSLPNMTASTHVKSTPTPAVEVETPEDERLTDSIDDSDLGKVPELDTISDFSDDSNDILPEDVNDTNTLADNTTEDQQAIEDPKETMVTKPESSEEKELTVKD
ncbi:MAG: BON domain-containing protein, partial [Thiotrichaceae bacterium]|nr:BON domain-containing protein [Thiotrichaceae bacterium]